MGDVIQFRLRGAPTRNQAMQWLCANYDNFPDSVPGDIGPSIFYGWRFALASSGGIYFANCIDAGISEMDFIECRRGAMRG